MQTQERVLLNIWGKCNLGINLLYYKELNYQKDKLEPNL